MIIIRWICNALALLAIAYIVPGMDITGLYAALITVAVLGLINAIIRPFIILLTLPVNILTLGVFTFVINALLFWLASTIVKGFTIEGFVPAFLGAFLLTIVSWVVSSIFKK